MEIKNLKTLPLRVWYGGQTIEHGWSLFAYHVDRIRFVQSSRI